MNNLTAEQQKVLKRNQILASLNKKEETKPNEVIKEEEKDDIKKDFSIKINITKNQIIFTFLFLIISLIIVFPKVNIVKYQSLDGIQETFYVTSDVLGFHDSKLLDTTFYDSIDLNDKKGTLSFCSNKNKNINCYDTKLIERKNFFSSLPSYITHINRN